ncbi:MAG TPA: maleylpyruvate isomerase N-terminal domain-containing protein [Terracidiphilus sp.]|nr:maleylpyruvate isomerase N-terminal domain-containing protein [Terracidiphilus sp.]
MRQERYCGTEPILCAHLLRVVDGKLLVLLRELTAEEWELPTIAGRWKVREVAAHLLDTALRKLSLVRDGWMVEKVEIRNEADLVALVNRLNAEGAAVYGRLSPAVLTGMLERVCVESAVFHEGLDPFAPAVFAVSWAGEAESQNWFDTARELTERWHHQQQIRMATGRPGIETRELYHPVMDCFLRGLPHAYRSVAARAGTAVRVEVTGECGGAWALVRGEGGWKFIAEHVGAFDCRVQIPQALAWRLFTKGVDRETARREVAVEGDQGLVQGIFALTAIVG